ncbi:hypothetical protein H6761_02995 [Candidatus Nomurabacteria bacterium]|nr:hypothetical protein [Candidatus Nomurabacteria bacterium]
MTRKNFFALLLLCLMAQLAMAVPGTRIWNGQEILSQTNPWGVTVCDTDGRPLTPVGETSTDFRHWQAGPTGFVPVVDGDELRYLVPTPDGFVPSGVVFPSNTPPATEELVREVNDAQRQSFNNNSGAELPIVQDRQLTVIPIILCAEYQDSLYFDDGDFYTHPDRPGESINPELWYQSFFASQMPDGAQSAYGREFPHSVAQLWENNQDVVVSHIVPDTERCSWYGDHPGLILDPETGQPFKVNVATTLAFDVNQLPVYLEQRGVNLQNMDPLHPVLFVFSGTHFMQEVMAYPQRGFAFVSAWCGTNSFMDFTPVDQLGPGWYMRAILQLQGYKETFIDMWVDDSDSGCWDAMGLGYCGFASNWRVPMDSPERHIYSPALWNPADRYKAGWLQNATPITQAGDFVLSVDHVYYLENPVNQEEKLYVSTWSNGPGSQMRWYPASEEAFGMGLVTASHGGLHTWWEGLETVAKLIYAERVSLDGDGYWPHDDRLAPFPTAGNSVMSRDSWDTTPTVFSWDLSFSVDGNLQTVLHLSNTETDQVILLPQDGMYQTEVPLAYNNSLYAPMYNAGVDVQQIQFNGQDQEGWINCSSQLSGNWEQNEVVPFFVPWQQLSLPSEQSFLGRRWHLDFAVQSLQPAGPLQTLATRAPLIGTPMSNFEIACNSDFKWSSNHGYLAIADNNQVRVYYESSLVNSWTFSEVRDLLLFNFSGDEVPELIVATDNQIRVWSLNGISTPQAVPGWPVSGDNAHQLMVLEDPELLVTGKVIAYVDGQYLVLRRRDGGLILPSRTSISLPTTVLPVRHMAYMGTDALGPHFALSGGSLDEPLLLTFDLDGHEGFRATRELFDNRSIEVLQLLSGDFLNNGFYDLMAIINVGPGNGDPYAYRALLMASWSEAEQQWVYNIDYLSYQNYTGYGPESMVPLVSDSPLEAPRVAFNMWIPHINPSPDSSRIFICDFSQEDWMSQVETIVDPELAHRYMLPNDLDNDGIEDLVAQKRGVGLEFWHGTSLDRWSDEALVHLSTSDHFPLPLVINGQTHFGQWEDGVLHFSNSLSTNWSSWPHPLGPGHSGQVKHLYAGNLLAPHFDLRLVAGRPVLTFEQHAACSQLKIYRSAEVYGVYELIATVPWDGTGGFQWQDNTLTGLPNTFYRATVEVIFDGPDGSSIR